MDLSKQELDALISAVTHYADHHLPDLVRTVPALGVSGQVDEVRGDCLRLLSRLRRELAAARQPVVTVPEPSQL